VGGRRDGGGDGTTKDDLAEGIHAPMLAAVRPPLHPRGVPRNRQQASAP
jgi:hypothetical protein